MNSCKLSHFEDTSYSAHFRSEHLTRLASTIFGTDIAVLLMFQVLCDVSGWGVVTDV